MNSAIADEIIRLKAIITKQNDILTSYDKITKRLLRAFRLLIVTMVLASIALLVGIFK